MATTHGLTNTCRREMTAWLSAKTRCYNTRAANFYLYGARGITMADEWRHDFPRFLADMGPCPDGHSLDRIDVNGPYAPGNCRWATRRQQQNNRRTNRVLELDGERRTLSEWARQLGMRKTALHERLRHGWPVARALTEPLHR